MAKKKKPDGASSLIPFAIRGNVGPQKSVCFSSGVAGERGGREKKITTVWRSSRGREAREGRQHV